jgi:hypothetical protein
MGEKTMADVRVINLDNLENGEKIIALLKAMLGEPKKDDCVCPTLSDCLNSLALVVQRAIDDLEGGQAHIKRVLPNKPVNKTTSLQHFMKELDVSKKELFKLTTTGLKNKESKYKDFMDFASQIVFCLAMLRMVLCDDVPSQK